MPKLEFNVDISGESDNAALAEAAEQIKDALAEQTNFENPAAVPIKGSRGVAEVAAVIAVALTVVVDIDKGLEAIESIFARFKTVLANSDKKSEQILAGLTPSDIWVNVDGTLVPLNKLTDEHLAWLRSQ